MKRSLVVCAAAVLLLAACERPPVEMVQRGYRGTGMDQVYNPRLLATQAPLNAAPETLPAVPAGGPKAGEVFKNVKVLGELGIAEFTRTMQAMTNWVSPKEGCNYCHNPQDLADDSKYQKVVARRMLEMTRHVNADWKPHVGGTGVTCYTCHRGNHVPEQTWFQAPAQKGTFAGNRAGQNAPARTVAYTALPNDPFTPFLQGATEIRIIGAGPLPPPGQGPSVQQAEGTYGLMMHMSQSLGVNCTYCHNSRSFQSWDQSAPQRATAWHGIRMLRDLNGTYLQPLTGSFPATRLGPGGDVAKLNCATCHQGAFKPLLGVAMAPAYPALGPSPP
ncbi:MAG: photosynthetic reaction center cytochrome PufC [Rubrivivax sp.]